MYENVFDSELKLTLINQCEHHRLLAVVLWLFVRPGIQERARGIQYLQESIRFELKIGDPKISKPKSR